MKLICTWCCREVESDPCEICGNYSVTDADKPHRPEWSRATINTVECKVCGRSGPHSIQCENHCPGLAS